MPDTTLVLEIDGDEIKADALAPLIEIHVEDSVDVADAATVVARLEPSGDGEWASMLDPLVAPRTKVVVQLTRGGTVYRFDGRAVDASWSIDAAGTSKLTVRALDGTADMDAEEKIVAWPGTSDSGAVTAIFGSYGFDTEVTDTPAGPDPDVHVLLQRGTDWQFVRALADRWGYAAYLECDGEDVVGHFHPLDPLADPDGELALGFGGDATNVTVHADLVAGRRVEAARIPTLSDTPGTADVTGDDEAQGSRSLAGATTIVLSPDDVAGEIDPEAASTGLARRTAFAVTLDVEIDPDKTGLLLRAGRTVLVKGLGSTLSGRYLVQRVRHTVTTAAHKQSVTLVRNALGLKGDEPFGGGGLGGLL